MQFDKIILSEILNILVDFFHFPRIMCRCFTSRDGTKDDASFVKHCDEYH